MKGGEIVAAPEQHIHLPEESSDAVQNKALDVRLLDRLLLHEEQLVRLVIDIASVAKDSSLSEAKMWKKVTSLQLEVLDARERVSKQLEDDDDGTKTAAAGLLLDKAAQLMGVGPDAKEGGDKPDIAGILAGLDDDTKAALLQALASAGKKAE